MGVCRYELGDDDTSMQTNEMQHCPAAQRNRSMVKIRRWRTTSRFLAIVSAPLIHLADSDTAPVFSQLYQSLHCL